MRTSVFPLLALIGLAWAGTAAAQTHTEHARVLSSTPVVAPVQVPQQVCVDEQVLVPGRSSGAGAAMGGIAGGALGNAVGNGSGRDVATAIGLIGGAILGDRIEQRSPDRTEWVRRCSTQHTLQHQTVGYDVVYEYGGKQYRTRITQAPGEWVPIHISPVPPAASMDTPAPVVYRPPVRVAPASVQVLVQTSPVFRPQPVRGAVHPLWHVTPPPHRLHWRDNGHTRHQHQPHR